MRAKSALRPHGWIVSGSIVVAIAGCDTYVTLTRGVDGGRDTNPFMMPPSTGPSGGPTSQPDSGMSPCAPNNDGGPDFSDASTVGDDAPPISGGTLIVTHDGRFAVASEPDEDAVYIVDRAAQTRRAVMLDAHDEPGRIAEDGDGIVHVVLRGGGAIVRIDPATATLLSRDAVCEAPRGIAYHAASQTIRVACMDGRLLTLPAAGGAPTAAQFVGEDLRDVVFDATGAMYLTQFRKLQILRAPSDGGPFTPITPYAEPFSPARVGWRLVPRPTDGYVLLHQLESSSPIDVRSCNAYGGMQPIVQTAVEVFTTATTGGASFVVDDAPVAVDVAVSSDGGQLAIAVAGNGFRGGPAEVRADVIRYARDAGLVYGRFQSQSVDGQAIAVAFAPDGHLIVQTRAPAAVIEDGGIRIALGTPRNPGLGHAIFHTATSAGLACASCHAEGNDDGHVWTFVPSGARRTQTFRGGFSATAPFHWDGAEADMTALVSDVYVHRMGGATLNLTEQQALANWMEHLPSLPHVVASDAASVERGRALFADSTVGCATCHAGDTLTNNATVDVGTGGPLQVPSLRGLRWRAPYMHTGCAETISGRFDPACGGGEAHGHTAALTDAQRADLVAYLETL